jgi:hypothetical protein
VPPFESSYFGRIESDLSCWIFISKDTSDATGIDTSKAYGQQSHKPMAEHDGAPDSR